MPYHTRSGPDAPASPVLMTGAVGCRGRAMLTSSHGSGHPSTVTRVRGRLPAPLVGQPDGSQLRAHLELGQDRLDLGAHRGLGDKAGTCDLADLLADHQQTEDLGLTPRDLVEALTNHAPRRHRLTVDLQQLCPTLTTQDRAPRPKSSDDLDDGGEGH